MAKKIEDAIREAEEHQRNVYALATVTSIPIDDFLDAVDRVEALRAAQARGETTVEDGAEARRQETLRTAAPLPDAEAPPRSPRG